MTVPARALVDAREAISQAVQRAISREQFAATALRGLSHLFDDAQVLLALRSGEGLVPVWPDPLPPGSQPDGRHGPLWDLAVQAAISGEPQEGPDGLALPIHDGQTVLGALAVGPGRHEAEHKEMASFAAQELSQALAQLQDLHQVHRLSRELAILNSLAKNLTSSRELGSVLEATLEGIRALFDVELLAIGLLDTHQGKVLYRVPVHRQGEWAGLYNFDFSGSLAAEVLESLEPRVLNLDQPLPEPLPELEGLEGIQARSLLCVPLRVRDRAIGILEVINKAEGPFDSHDVELLVTLASTVAAAIDNARLFLELTVANADLEASRSEIARSRSTLLALFDNLDDELYIVSRSYNLVAVNRARADRVGKDPRELVGRRCFEALEGRQSPCPNCRVMETFESGAKTKRVARLWAADHDAREMEIYTYPILDGDDVAYTILQLRDVTEQRRLEASLAQAEKLAAVGQLAAGVAHELNNPLTAVIANTQLIKRELPDGSPHRESLDLIEQAGQRAQQVVRDLLNFARQEPPEFTLVDVNQSIRQAMALVERQWSASNVRLLANLAPDLPPVRGNADHLQSVWLNLLVNARDALEGRPGTIEVETLRQGDIVTIRVSDDGMGIPPEHLQKIFEPFFTTKGPGKGTGLGLATCYRIVKQHNGIIHIDSAPGQGTCVTVRLPVAPEATSAGFSLASPGG